MANRLAMALLFVFMGQGAIADEGIPYQLECLGAKSKTGARLQLKLEQEQKLSKVYLDEKGNPSEEKEYYTVNSIGPTQKLFSVVATFDGVFAGSGSKVGAISFKLANKKGTWTETTTTFDESKGVEVVEKRTTKVVCELVQ